jgi:hypothetical protein
MAKQDSIIKFQAQICGIRTTIDGGSNVTFSLSGTEVKALTQLLQVRQQVGAILEVVAVPVKQIKPQEPKKKNEPRRKQRYPYRTKS